MDRDISPQKVNKTIGQVQEQHTEEEVHPWTLGKSEKTLIKMGSLNDSIIMHTDI